MTQPPPDLPPTALDDARAALFAALQRVWMALGWPAERAHKHPPEALTAPAAFVDVPVLAEAVTENARTFAATFPVVFAVDGGQQQQVELVDALLAYGWDQLDRVKVGGRGVRVLTFGPEDVDAGGVLVRGLVARVQVPLQSRTLCRQTLAQDSDEGTT